MGGKRVNLDRSTLHYYFRTREELIFPTTDEIAQRYVSRFLERILAFDPGEPAQQLVEYLFGGSFHQPGLSIVIEELGVYANGNPAIDRRVSDIYRAVEKAIVTEIDSEFPKSSKQARLYVALRFRNCWKAILYLHA